MKKFRIRIVIDNETDITVLKWYRDLIEHLIFEKLGVYDEKKKR